MKPFFYTASILLLLTGCATASRTYTSGGEEGYNINCSGNARNWGMCYEKAGDICGSRGFVVLERSGDQGSAFSGNQFGLYGSSVTTRSMIISCK